MLKYLKNSHHQDLKSVLKVCKYNHPNSIIMMVYNDILYLYSHLFCRFYLLEHYLIHQILSCPGGDGETKTSLIDTMTSISSTS